MRSLAIFLYEKNASVKLTRRLFSSFGPDPSIVTGFRRGWRQPTLLRRRNITSVRLRRFDDQVPIVAYAVWICRPISDIRNHHSMVSDSTYCANRECYVFMNIGILGPGVLEAAVYRLLISQ